MDVMRINKNEGDILNIVTEGMINIGIPAHLRGYHYIREGVTTVVYDNEAVVHVTKELYPDIAKRFKTSPEKVERCIRNAIETAFKKHEENFNDFFGMHWKERPTNSEFIATFADKIRLDLK